MPTITCERCGASVFTLVVGPSMDVKGGHELHRCKALAGNAEEAEEVTIDLVLECDDMERAIDKSVMALTDAGTPVDITWPVDTGGRREYERWELLTGVLEVGNRLHQCIVRDISPGGASVWSETASEISEGARAVLEPEGHERLPAEVTHKNAGALGLKFTLSSEQRNRTAEWLMRLRQSLGRARSMGL